MIRWELKSYFGREIKTPEDVEWVCEKIKKRTKDGLVSWEDIGALTYVKELHQHHIDSGYFGFIESRFDILDL